MNIGGSSASKQSLYMDILTHQILCAFHQLKHYNVILLPGRAVIVIGLVNTLYSSLSSHAFS